MTIMILDNVLVKDPSEEDINKTPKEKQTLVKLGRIRGMVFECWWLNIEKQSTIDFQYAIGDSNIKELRQSFFDKHKVSPVGLRSIILPPEYVSEKGVKIPDGI